MAVNVFIETTDRRSSMMWKLLVLVLSSRQSSSRVSHRKATAECFCLKFGELDHFETFLLHGGLSWFHHILSLKHAHVPRSLEKRQNREIRPERRQIFPGWRRFLCCADVINGKLKHKVCCFATIMTRTVEAKDGWEGGCSGCVCPPHHVVQSLRHAVVSGVDEVDFGTLHGHRAATCDLPGHLQSSGHHGLFIRKHSTVAERKNMHGFTSHTNTSSY